MSPRKVTPVAGGGLGQSTFAPQKKFVFVVCQHGVERLVKTAILSHPIGAKLAFSRSGLLTFKAPEGVEFSPQLTEQLLQPVGWAVRLYGWPLTIMQGESIASMAREVVDLAIASGYCDTGESATIAPRPVHVFPRDRDLPGHQGYEPGPDELARNVLQQIEQCSGGSLRGNWIARRGSTVLDVIISEPTQWLVGWHRADQVAFTWPGAVFPCPEPEVMVSRAYRKMAEAVAWSGLPLRAGDRVVEIGSAPGGAAQRLLDLGLYVVGIDPAEMDPLILRHPRFEHWRGKSCEIRRRRYAIFDWLAADMNVAPGYTLDAVEDIVTYPTTRIRGLLLTLKLSSYDLAKKFGEYRDRVRGWGFRRVKMRQLAYNRREICLVAQR